MGDEMLIGVISLGLIAVVVGLLLPGLVSPVTEDASSTIQLDNQTDHNLTDILELELTRINETTNETNITLENLRTLESNKTGIVEGNTESLNLSGDSITIDADEIVDNDTAQFSVSYPPMFGYDSGARKFFANMDLILVILGSLMIFGSLMAAIP